MKHLVFVFGLLLPSLVWAEPLRITANTTPTNTYRWLDGKTRSLGGLVYDGKDVTVARNVIRFWGEDDSNTVVRNATFRLAAPTTNPGDLPVALEYVGGHDHLIENVTARGFYSVPREGEYENGDCFSGEPNASRITFRNVTASGCSDGGFDFKSIDVRFENVVAEDVSKGFRIWGTATGSLVTCRRWKAGCVQTNQATARPSASLVIDKLILDPDPASDGVVAGINKGSTVTVRSCAGTLSKRLIFWQEGANPTNSDVTLCGVKVTTKDEAILRPLVEAQMAKDVRPVSASALSSTAVPAILCTFPAKLRDGSGDGVIELGSQNAMKCGGKAGLRVKLLLERSGAFGYGRAD